MRRLLLLVVIAACAPDVGDAEARERRERHRDVAKLEPGRLAELVERAERLRHPKDTVPREVPPPPVTPPPPAPPKYIPLYRVTLVIPDVGKREMLVFDVEWKDGYMRYHELKSCMASLDRKRSCWATWVHAGQVRFVEFVREIPYPFES